MYKDSTLLYKYKNGNYYVRIFEDGTKERFTMEDEFNPTFPESIDLKITGYCDMNCPMCHEDSSTNGTHAELDAKFLDTLQYGIELAIGGGNPLSHPQLLPFLNRLKEKGIIANMTVNEQHFLQNSTFLKELIDNKLIYGLGVSLNKYDPKTFELTASYPHTIFHVILGIVDKETLLKIPSGKKILLLGYKKFGRGVNFYSDKILKNIEDIEKNFVTIKHNFTNIGFDNLALEQLHIEKHLPPHMLRQIYMGDDGKFTMYIDLVKKEFAVSSTSTTRYHLEDNIEKMFAVVRNEK